MHPSAFSAHETTTPLVVDTAVCISSGSSSVSCSLSTQQSPQCGRRSLFASLRGVNWQRLRWTRNPRQRESRPAHFSWLQRGGSLAKRMPMRWRKFRPGGSRCTKRTVLLCIIALMVTLGALVAIFGLRSVVTTVTHPFRRLLTSSHHRSDASDKAKSALRCVNWPCGPLTLPIAVLVQHSGSSTRLSLALSQPAWPPPTCAEDYAFCAANGTENPRLSRDLLPSWTLNTVDAACGDCVDRYAYDLAVRDAQLSGSRGVFAVPRSPRGLLGPMLFAMASVTDDVDVAAELPRWGWMRHVYSGFPAHGSTAPPRRTLLAVMGIPSTDHPARRTLRDAQRETWMSYSEVARSENGFEGALLPLFLFAAAEPFRPSAETGQAELETTAALCPLCNNVSTLLPTRDEFTAVSRAELAKERAGGPVAMGDAAVSVRRVQLRAEWRAADAAAASPCGRVVARDAVAGSAASWVAAMRSALSLPVTPAYVAPARYVCCTSAALWREALEYRNVVWLDMMADRRPTTAKKLGTSARWGMPAEIGMSQKLVLWLVYAYHAFRNVPFIVKGDDDAYIKVPQYLNDIRFFSSGGRVRTFSQSPTSEVTAHLDPYFEMREDAALTPDQVECAYWGSVRNFYAYEFSAGMNLKVHRHVVQAMLEQYYLPREFNWMRFAMEDFNASWEPAYRKKMFHHEDIMLGVKIGRIFERVRQRCLGRRMWFIKEDFSKLHDMHRGKEHNVTWATVVAHRCSPADAYFLHQYFRDEHKFARVPANQLSQWEKEAQADARLWAAKQKEKFARDGLHPYVVGWDDLPATQWTRLPNLTSVPPFRIDLVDGVAVYESEYVSWQHNKTRVFHGLVSHVFPYVAIPI